MGEKIQSCHVGGVVASDVVEQLVVAEGWQVVPATDVIDGISQQAFHPRYRVGG